MVPLTTEYWDRVVSHTVGEISHGRTPNPDILCNSRVKFGAFYDHLSSGAEGEFDRVASGHYAHLLRPPAAAAASEEVMMRVRSKPALPALLRLKTFSWCRT